MPTPRPASARPGRALLRPPGLVVAAALAAALAIPPALAHPAEGSAAGAPSSASAAPAASRAAARPAASRSARPAASRGNASRAAPRAAARPAAARGSARPAPARAAATPRAARPAAAPPAAVLRVIDQAARRTGVEAELLVAIAWRESRFDPRAENRLSSARGLMQFTAATWLETLRDHGAAHGLAREAAALSTDARTGTITAPGAREQERLLALRDDALLSATLAGARLAAQRPGLEAALGREARAADLYAVHMLGPAGARRFLGELARQPGARAADAVGAQAVARNRGVFFAGGRALTLREVHAAMARSTAEGSALLAAAPAAPTRLALAESAARQP